MVGCLVRFCCVEFMSCGHHHGVTCVDGIGQGGIVEPS
jgi:hypothetical protein